MSDVALLPREPFFYLRHGQTDWNVEGRCQGQTDIPMNAAGEVEVAASVARLPMGEIARIIASPLTRTQQSARHASDRLGLPVELDDDLKEAFWGDAEGKADTSWRPAWCAGKTLFGAEPFSDFAHRMVRGVTRALAQEGTPLIVGHGGAYWAIEQALGRDGFSHLPNGTLLKHTPHEKDPALWRVTFI
ncbi:Phosphoglycerate mutase family [Candidatus Phaeomarinobacter ectocarpi]|uniref:Phosphoglycerate mutase family n=1 Tax=Candidatus Phaeomarinibacter ectocarpi TaxID=1458461 RepID=X5MLZ1_9HYPH|nr:histidine phosphatase family protein [Candidatus Phaeomarinobacter ectocarpi]CDO58806.1 Phosphoglycerate mutase family [Candidatus Phaeomarinobacter ectocarpi]